LKVVSKKKKTENTNYTKGMGIPAAVLHHKRFGHDTEICSNSKAFAFN